MDKIFLFSITIAILGGVMLANSFLAILAGLLFFFGLSAAILTLAAFVALKVSRK